MNANSRHDEDRVERVRDKSLACLAQLPDETRRALADFLALSAAPEAGAQDMAEELSASIALKETFAVQPRDRN